MMRAGGGPLIQRAPGLDAFLI